MALADGTLRQAEKLKLTMTPNPRRDTHVYVNLDRFDKMLTGSEEGRRWVVRARIDPFSKSHAMRDPVIFESAMNGKQWVTSCTEANVSSLAEAYPTHDFASPVVDHLDGVTHVIRSVEHLEKQEQYMWFADRLGLRQTVISHLP